MAQNWRVSDIYSYDYTEAMTTSTLGSGANANTGLMWRAADSGDNNEVRLLQAGTLNQVLTVTAANVIGWADPDNEVSTNTEFRATVANAQTITTSLLTVKTLVIFGTEHFDPGNNYHNGTGLYTCPSDGRYLFHSMIQWDSSGANKSNKGSRYMAITVDPTGTPTDVIESTEQPNSNKNIDFVQRLTVILDCTATDDVGVRVSQNSGSSLDVGTLSQFMGGRLS